MARWMSASASRLAPSRPPAARREWHRPAPATGTRRLPAEARLPPRGSEADVRVSPDAIRATAAQETRQRARPPTALEARSAARRASAGSLLLKGEQCPPLVHFGFIGGERGCAGPSRRDGLLEVLHVRQEVAQRQRRLPGRKARSHDRLRRIPHCRREVARRRTARRGHSREAAGELREVAERVDCRPARRDALRDLGGEDVSCAACRPPSASFR